MPKYHVKVHANAVLTDYWVLEATNMDQARAVLDHMKNIPTGMYPSNCQQSSMEIEEETLTYAEITLTDIDHPVDVWAEKVLPEAPTISRVSLAPDA